MVPGILMRVPIAKTENSMHSGLLGGITLSRMITGKQYLINSEAQILSYKLVALLKKFWACMCIKPLVKIMSEITLFGMTVEKFLSLNASR